MAQIKNKDDAMKLSIQEKLKENINLFKAAVQKPKEVSTVFPTSSALAKRLLAGNDFAQAQLVVELGPGTGAITRPLLRRLSPNCDYLGIELVDDLVRLLNQEFPQKKFVTAPAQSLGEFLDGKKADVVISSLPWTLMDAHEQSEILSSITNNLQPQGSFCTYVCINAAWYPAALRLRQQLIERFTTVTKSPIVWANLPPAFVYHCAGLRTSERP